MNITTARIRASHVNIGTSIPRDEQPWPEATGRVFRLPRAELEVERRSEVTPYGGLALATKMSLLPLLVRVLPPKLTGFRK